jgi:hypothetical protein
MHIIPVLRFTATRQTRMAASRAEGSSNLRRDVRFRIVAPLFNLTKYKDTKYLFNQSIVPE